MEYCELSHYAKGYCCEHYGRWKRTGNAHKPETKTTAGTINFHGYREVQHNGKRVLEHRLVMCQMLDRELYPGENVHHLNGNRADNRPENLELWVKSQPCGQRPVDLVAWAHEILDRYGALVESRT